MSEDMSPTGFQKRKVRRDQSQIPAKSLKAAFRTRPHYGRDRQICRHPPRPCCGMSAEFCVFFPLFTPRKENLTWKSCVEFFIKKITTSVYEILLWQTENAICYDATRPLDLN